MDKQLLINRENSYFESCTKVGIISQITIDFKKIKLKGKHLYNLEMVLVVSLSVFLIALGLTITLVIQNVFTIILFYLFILTIILGMALIFSITQYFTYNSLKNHFLTINEYSDVLYPNPIKNPFHSFSTENEYYMLLKRLTDINKKEYEETFPFIKKNEIVDSIIQFNQSEISALNDKLINISHRTFYAFMGGSIITITLDKTIDLLVDTGVIEYLIIFGSSLILALFVISIFAINFYNFSFKIFNRTIYNKKLKLQEFTSFLILKKSENLIIDFEANYLQDTHSALFTTTTNHL